MTDTETTVPFVLTERRGHILIASLNRPERLNAVGQGMEAELGRVLREAGSDHEIRAIVLRAEGRAFCAGGDVKVMAAGPGDSQSAAARSLNTLHGAEIVEAIHAVPQPIVAAVQGFAMGLGATIALLSDVVIAAEDAVFADTHVVVGLVAGDGGAVVWPLNMSLARARWHLMTGEWLRGAAAAEIGLILKAVPASDLLDEAISHAEKLASLSPLAVQGTKATIKQIVRDRIDLVLEYGLLREGIAAAGEDATEAARAFQEKRQPNFRYA
jgi:enoyl-CoA hydratase